ncbi:MAG: ATP-dependent RecD-like DNA helicase [Mollicutes bacterium]|nr:ATP-dependent RecD-like DNA helicase [Mollicutes bacterium]
MKKYILGNIRKIIYESNNGPYKVGIFKVRETNDDEMREYVNKVIGFTGNFVEVNPDVDYILYGRLVEHPKYGTQFDVLNYEIKAPSDLDSLVLYLSSGMFKGIGLKTAKRIVERFGPDTIKTIKENPEDIATVSGMTITKARRMHDKILENEYNQELILKLNGYGFSVREAIDLITIYGSDLSRKIEENIYDLVEHITFDKLDIMFLKDNDEMDKRRIEALILHNIYTTCYETGDTLVLKDELFIKMKKCFRGVFTVEEYLKYIESLALKAKIVLFNEYVTLSEFYNTEKSILIDINRINDIKNTIKSDKIDTYISEYEKINSITFNNDQKEAIKGAILNNFFIITGGPGTGKTTIIKAIVMILKDILDLNHDDIALLAPTGRASKRMAESVGAPAYTIHKFLKWNKETESFLIDEYNKSHEKIVIVDESSMIDIFLFSSLLKGLKLNVKLILVGDANQLPSIGPGDLLNDLLHISTIKNKYLNTIYRVKEGSYITYLANDIKNRKHFDKFPTNYSDFKFIESDDDNIKKYLKEIVNKAVEKGISSENFQVLAPMYKGINGIDSLNSMMAEIFNPNAEKFIIGDKYYRINDKVIQLVNDVDNNVYNGDIGYIKDIYYIDKKLIVEIDYSGNIVEYKNGEFDKFNLAYAVSIHKSQGSEYANVVIILASSFNRMFYNKLIYTAVTRAKSSLIILGSIDSLNKSVLTNYGANRNTYLKYV